MEHSGRRRAAGKGCVSSHAVATTASGVLRNRRADGQHGTGGPQDGQRDTWAAMAATANPLDGHAPRVSRNRPTFGDPCHVRVVIRRHSANGFCGPFPTILACRAQRGAAVHGTSVLITILRFACEQPDRGRRFSRRHPDLHAGFRAGPARRFACCRGRPLVHGRLGGRPGGSARGGWRRGPGRDIPGHRVFVGLESGQRLAPGRTRTARSPISRRRRCAISSPGCRRSAGHGRRFERELRRAARAEQRLSVAAIDLDRLKTSTTRTGMSRVTA